MMFTKSILFALFLLPSLTDSACPNSENPIGAGNVSSPNYPMPYENNANCTYLLTANSLNSTNTTISYSIVMLEIVDFSTEDNYDYIMIYDGPSINSPAIFTYTRFLFINESHPWLCLSRMNGPNMGSRSINSTQRYMTIQFITDATIVDRGFFATYTSAIGIVRFELFRIYSFLQVPFPSAVPTPMVFPLVTERRCRHSSPWTTAIIKIARTTFRVWPISATGVKSATNILDIQGVREMICQGVKSGLPD